MTRSSFHYDVWRGSPFAAPDAGVSTLRPMKPRVLLLALLCALLTGCGFVLTKGPPTGHEQMLAFSCTESNAGPILDIVWGSLNVLGAATAAADPEAYDNSGQ